MSRFEKLRHRSRYQGSSVMMRKASRTLSRRLAIEPLEARHLLATVTLQEGNLLVSDSTGNTNDALTVLSDAVNERFEISDPGNLLTTTIPGATGSGTNTVHVPFAAVTGTQLTVNAQSGLDTVMIGGQFAVSVSIDTGGNDGFTDVINLNADATFAADRSILASADTVNVGAGADIVISGTGTITIAAFNVEIDATATLVSASTVTITHEAPFTGRNINLGSENPSLFLSLTDAELDRITAHTTRIVTTNGQLSVSGTISHANHLLLMTNAGSMPIGFPITMAADKNFTAANATQSIQLFASSSAITTSGTGAISLTAAQSFSIAGGSSLTTQNGGINILANGGNAIAGPQNLTIHGTVTSTGTGNISITGLSSTGQAGGVLIQGTIQSTSAANAPTQGRIRIEGVNGTNDGANLHGVHITGAGLVTSDGGDIEIVGRGGSGPLPIGVLLRLGSGGIVARNNASISIDGIGGVGQAPIGFYFSRAPATSVISSQNGSIHIRGTGGTAPTGANAEGASFYNNTSFSTPMVSSTQGDITIEGTGGSSTALDHGILMLRDSGSASMIRSTAGGSIVLDGVAGSGTGSFATYATNNAAASLVVTDMGDVTFVGDSFERVGGGFVASVTGGGLTFVPKTAGVPISLGGADVVTGNKVLGLSNFDLEGSAAFRFVIGSTLSGDISVDADIAPSSAPGFERDMELVSAGNIVFNASLRTFAMSGSVSHGAVLLAPGANGVVRPLATGQDLITRNASSTFATSFTPGANLEINIGGTTVDTQYSRLTALGVIALAGVDLSVTGPFASSLNDVFTIVSADNITGQFNGLPENKVFTHNGRSLRVNYTATTVTLTDVGQPPTIDVDAAAVSTGEGSPVTNTGTFNDPDGNATATVTASIGTIMQNNALGTWSWSLPTTDGPAGPFEVTLTVTDVWGATDTVTFQYTVNNLPPILTNAGGAIADEGQTATNTGSWSDPGVDDVTLSASLGAVVKNGDGTWSWSFATSDGPDQSQMVTITATDSDGAQSQTMFSLTVNNLPPTVANAGSVTVGEGQLATNSGTWGDPGVDIVTLAASVGAVVKNGDGTWSWSFAATDGPDQSQTVTITATDSDGAVSQTMFGLTVNNVAPVVTELDAPAEMMLGGTAAFSGEFEDPGDDEWHGEAEIERTGQSPVVVPVVVHANKTFTFQYQFPSAGLYDVTVTVFDDEAGTPLSQTAMILVFLPGDYDRNGAVEQADYNVWRQHYGATSRVGLQADGNADGNVDAADYVVWRKNLGMTAAASVEVTTMTEELATTSAASENASVQVVVASIGPNTSDADRTPSELTPTRTLEDSKAPAIQPRSTAAANSMLQSHGRSETTNSVALGRPDTDRGRNTASKVSRLISPRLALVHDDLLLELATRRLTTEDQQPPELTRAAAGQGPVEAGPWEATDLAFATVDFDDAWATTLQPHSS